MVLTSYFLTRIQNSKGVVHVTAIKVVSFKHRYLKQIPYCTYIGKSGAQISSISFATSVSSYKSDGLLLGPVCPTFVICFRRKIRLIKGNAKCRHLKKFTSKGLLRQGPDPYPPPPLTN
jgi:hypothetical protein